MNDNPSTSNEKNSSSQGETICFLRFRHKLIREDKSGRGGSNVTSLHLRLNTKNIHLKASATTTHKFKLDEALACNYHWFTELQINC